MYVLSNINVTVVAELELFYDNNELCTAKPLKHFSEHSAGQKQCTHVLLPMESPAAYR